MRRGLAAVAVLGFVLAGCGGKSSKQQGAGSTGATAAAGTVTVRNVAFKPASVTVASGQSVRWTFADGDLPHNVDFGSFRSGDPVTTGTYEHTFAQPGTFSYHCDVHPNMQGIVTVKG